MDSQLQTVARTKAAMAERENMLEKGEEEERGERKCCRELK